MKSRWMLWVAGAVLLLGAGVAAALLLTSRRDITTSSSAAREIYKEAVANEARFYFKEARIGFAKALELDPNFAMAMLGLARQSGMEQGKALVKRAAREEPRLTEHERLLVELHLAGSERRYGDQKKLVEELHAKYPDDQRAAVWLAHDAQQRGKPEEAVKYFQDLIAIDPNNADAYNQLGYHYGYRGDYEKAMENLQKYQFIAPDTANPFDSLGENQAYAGHYTEAIENLNRALAVKADFSPAYEHLGVVYEGMGDLPKALASYRKALELAESDEYRGKYLPEAFRAACRSKDVAAVEEFREILVKLPKAPWTELRLESVDALKALAAGRYAEAESRLEALQPKALAKWNELDSKSPSGDKAHFAELNAMLALAKEALGKTDEAFKLWEANAKPPKDYSNYEDRRYIIEARAQMAATLARRGDLEAAEKLIAENRKWNPSWAPTREAENTVAELRRAKVLAASK
jgi:tetratricopeptide (TPR) repeat protein